MLLEPGAVLGPYRIVEQLGAGGMAEVYKAFHARLGLYRAIKVVLPFFAHERDFAARFEQEAVAVARLRHPHILEVIDYGEERGLAYLVTEFVDGGDLSQRVGQPLPPADTARLLVPVASALDEAHAHNIIHRDVKPSNILLRRDGTPVLSDFGIAKITDASLHLTGTGNSIGTPAYQSPEQAEGKPASPATDQYALAVVAYQMLTGQVPFTAETPMAVLIAHLTRPLPPPRSVNPALSEPIEAALLKGLAREPGDRFPTVSAFAMALVQAAGVIDPSSVFGSSPSSYALFASPLEATAVQGNPATGQTVPALQATAPWSSTTPTAQQVVEPAVTPHEPETALPIEATHTDKAASYAPPTVAATPPMSGTTYAEPESSAHVTAMPVKGTDERQTRVPRALAMVAGAGVIALLVLAVYAFVHSRTTSSDAESPASNITSTASSSSTSASGTDATPIPTSGGSSSALNLFQITVGPRQQATASVVPETAASPAPAETTTSNVGLFRLTAVPEAATPAAQATAAPAATFALPPMTATPASTGTWSVLFVDMKTPGQFLSAHGVAIDKQGNIYVTDRQNDRVRKLSPAGALLATWGTGRGLPGPFSSPRGIAVDGQGNIYVADSSEKPIHKLSPDGQIVAEWGAGGTDPGEFGDADQIALDAQGNVYVADRDNHRIQKLSPNGEPMGQWGVYGAEAGQFQNPTGVAVDAQGNIYVSDSGNNRVQKLSPTGQPLAVWGVNKSGNNTFLDPSGITLDAASNVYVVDNGNRRIAKLSPSGQVLQTWGTDGTAPGQFRSPWGIALDAQGNLYVADEETYRIQKLVFGR